MELSSNPPGEAGRRDAVLWLALAICAVAVSGLFAVLIALARVPALGTLFPGPEFYRVALTLHVNLSQGVWFMAFAGVLWSLAAPRAPGETGRAAWWAAAGGALGMVLSVADGRPEAIMSNYVPVLDSPLFLAALALFGIGVLIKAAQGARAGCPWPLRDAADVQRLALFLAALETLAVFALLLAAGVAMPGGETGYAYFETLFWGGGHLWQFALASLLMVCWLELAPAGAQRLAPGALAAIVGAGALPVLAALAVPFLHVPESAEYVHAYTWLMQWTSWQAPLALALALAWSARGRWGREIAPGFGLSLLLFVAGLLLGSLIDGQTTLVTAHYHGTIGAVTLGFMAASFALLPRLGIAAPGRRALRLQLGFYGYGILLMMAGLAGAGLMGAPRKTPGDLSATWGVETFSRICLGVGGLLATIGILMFAVLLVRRLFPAVSAAYSR
ncbi:cbb3-type cytochrome c oxidase subunit I [Azospira restricta]|uniref:Cbb3-type cytochrome c oxidase subunit I n=1 Tax=Azospira restricta TaxID=404405 RepID=A0A974PWV7_9RHOO|nr:cbb3-type cytochrome c oxidase subunit I [Azospira restricta]QRJ62420.1 cbb3-type cytochrome c oxidase subunit I [Azospira restricta]